MPKKSLVDFKAVKASVRMEQVLEHYGIRDQFKGNGDSLSGRCPIHKGNNPTQFRVSKSKNIWNCFSECKHGGNVLDFISRMENVSIYEAAVKAIEWFGLNPDAMSADAPDDEPQADELKTERQVSASKPKSAAPSAPAVLATPEKKAPNKPLGFRLDKLNREHPYLAERGLTRQTVIDFGIGHCEKGMMADRIAIPIHNPKGEVVAYAGRSIGEPSPDIPKYKLPNGFLKSLELYNIDRALKEPSDKPLVIVEGFFGCMKLHQHGCHKVVALMGSSMSPEQEELIRRATDRNSLVILVLDEDEAGRNGREDIAVRVAKFAFVKIHVFSAEGQQADQLSAEEVVAIID